MTPITPSRLQQMIEAASKATPGPWEATYNDTIDIREQDGSRLAQCTMLYKGGSCRRPINDVEANAAHIAACDPQTIIALCRIALAAQRLRDQWTIPAYLDDALREAGLA